MYKKSTIVKIKIYGKIKTIYEIIKICTKCSFLLKIFGKNRQNDQIFGKTCK